MIPFGELRPDAKETAANVAMAANNVLPLLEGYGPLPSLSTPESAVALPDTPKGVVSIVRRSGAYEVYAFTASALHRLESDYTWLEVQAGYNCPSSDDWSAVHFGNQLLFTNTTDGLQAQDVETVSGVTAIPEAGDPRFVFTSSNMVVALNCLDENGNRNNRLIRTSAFGDHTNWTSVGADYQPLEDGEELVCGADLKSNAAVIFQKNAMRLMQFGNAGGGATFSLQKIADGRGSVGARSVVAFDGAAYFLATNGFWRFTIGGGLEPIGVGKIDQWFFDHVDQSSLALVQGSIDPYRKIIWWRYPALGDTSDDIFGGMIGYSWEFGRWVTATVETTYLARIATPAVSMDLLDSLGTVDEINIALDSREFQGGQPVFAALNVERKFSTFSGAALEATLRTATVMSPVTGLLTSCRPMTDARDGTVSIGHKNALYEELAWKRPVAIKPSGRCPVRARGLNVAVELGIPAESDWSYAKGVDHFDTATGGPR